ncbi:MAG: hypothetical protein IJV35_05505 [Neisseriaceae bacterium]|nr:hypothetical protein [Neisseriaceae bacterium]
MAYPYDLLLIQNLPFYHIQKVSGCLKDLLNSISICHNLLIFVIKTAKNTVFTAFRLPEMV